MCECGFYYQTHGYFKAVRPLSQSLFIRKKAIGERFYLKRGHTKGLAR